MKSYKKSLWGSIIAIIVGTSCCWLSSLAIWFGGAVIIGTVSSYIADIQVLLIIVAVVLLIISVLLYKKSVRH